jgi:signal transduction histidine kinase
MDLNTVWTSALTIIMALMGMVIRSRDKEIEAVRLDQGKDREEMQRLQVLLNRTREEVAKEYVTKVEVHADINRVLVRLEQLDAKLDRLILEKHNAPGK